MAQRIEHVGIHAFRLDPKQKNPRERIFARKWEKENERNLLHHLMFVSDETGKSKLAYALNARDAKIAATVIQWLGTNIGFSFIRECLDEMGFDLELKPKVLECCAIMQDQIDHRCDKCEKGQCPDQVVIREDGEYRMPIRDGGNSFLVVNFCPWCSKKLIKRRP